MSYTLYVHSFLMYYSIIIILATYVVNLAYTYVTKVLKFHKLHVPEYQLSVLMWSKECLANKKFIYIVKHLALSD